MASFARLTIRTLSYRSSLIPFIRAECDSVAVCRNQTDLSEQKKWIECLTWDDISFGHIGYVSMVRRKLLQSIGKWLLFVCYRTPGCVQTIASRFELHGRWVRIILSGRWSGKVVHRVTRLPVRSWEELIGIIVTVHLPPIEVSTVSVNKFLHLSARSGKSSINASINLESV